MDWEKTGEANNDFLLGLNRQADIPEKYQFDLIVDIETKDGEKEKHKMKYFFSKKESILGIQQMENTENFINIDNANDVIILYTVENGKKKAQAKPSAMKITGAFLKANQNKLELPEYSINKTGKSKKLPVITQMNIT